MSEPVVTVRGLRRSYGPVVALDGIDLDIGEGEVFALLGPNGAGKTTTVEILEGHRRRDGGEVSVLGVDPWRAPLAWRRGIGIVLQEATDAGELTVLETLRHFAGYFPAPHDPAEVLERVGLTEAAGRRVRALSGGQRRRLDVAIGVLGRPRLLFLDEPTTGFDPQARQQFWQLVGELRAEQGTTVLLTSHYLDEVEALADRVAVVVGGRIRAQGDPATVGGRLTGRATVSWRDGDETRSVATTEPERVVAELVARLGPSVPGLTVGRPRLEDVYLELVAEEKP